MCLLFTTVWVRFSVAVSLQEKITASITFMECFSGVIKSLEELFSKTNVFHKPQQTHKAKCSSKWWADSDSTGDDSDMVEDY